MSGHCVFITWISYGAAPALFKHDFRSFQRAAQRLCWRARRFALWYPPSYFMGNHGM
jgi:hypothetical protein